MEPVSTKIFPDSLPKVPTPCTARLSIQTDLPLVFVEEALPQTIQAGDTFYFQGQPIFVLLIDDSIPLWAYAPVYHDERDHKPFRGSRIPPGRPPWTPPTRGGTAKRLARP